MFDDNKIIITVSGSDKVGIVAKVATILSEHKVNIEDIKQTLMQGHFVMFMLGDISQSDKTLKELQILLKEECNKMGMEAWVQRKEIFDNMHSVG